MKISIDYGHGGKSPGVVSCGIMEEDLNRKVGEHIEVKLERYEKLKRYHVCVVMGSKKILYCGQNDNVPAGLT